MTRASFPKGHSVVAVLFRNGDVSDRTMDHVMMFFSDPWSGRYFDLVGKFWGHVVYRERA